jgi:ATP-dependent RNA helicase DeaD
MTTLTRWREKRDPSATITSLSSFVELPVHPLVATALAARGYDTATPVQAAVLDPGLAGRDLLVSSQTGSGKTVAFGTLIADSLLAGGPIEPAVPLSSRAPRALVVAPTRELGVQVGRELEWLFAKARTRLGTFTGGTPVFGDLRRLRAGVDIAVGTPGRLVDLHQRKALDLSAVAVLVLDEADEMLDLGFKDDLEYLLGNAPATRRTLLFSATLPREIERMAATFQRDASRIDPRPGGAREEHADIRHVAHLVRPQDRLAAVVNVLLATGEARAIVFCRTRERVGELHQCLVDLGFKAAAISGERTQGERDRALDAVREGRARVLVATNVAARGLDLPDVDVVIHADLPDSADSLTHRSGRTGRAGKKGTSMVIADLTERRKAERLLTSARISVRWTPAPTAGEVRRSLEECLVARLLEESRTLSRDASGAQVAQNAGEARTGEAGADLDSVQQIAALADRLRAILPERVLVPLLLAREVDRLPAALALEPVSIEPRRAGPAPAPRARGAGSTPRHGQDGDPERPRERAFGSAVIFRVNLGADARAEPGWLLPLICRRGGITRREVGAIRVGPRSSTFEIATAAANDFARAASHSDPRAPEVVIEPVSAIASPGRPQTTSSGKPSSSPPVLPAPRRPPASPPHRASPSLHVNRDQTGGAKPPRRKSLSSPGWLRKT